MKTKFIYLVISLFLSTISLYAQEKPKDFYKEGSKEFKKGMYTASIPSFTKAIELDKNYTDAYFDRAQA
ncbi:MAG: hypothetical protein JW729_01735, partial [Bacteroidales bacterium]|nr:hypothetical protein [Bacteroidales bacterium]